MRTRLYSILSVTLLFGFSGCHSLGKMPNPFSGAKQEPRRCVAVWSPAARVVGGVPERGFAGRVTFFGSDPKKGVKIDGDIVVYAFDEYPGRSAGNTVPDKTYPFFAEDVKLLQSYSKKLGHSYNLWVPWDNAGPEGERKTVSLIVKLVQKNGNPVTDNAQARCVLPGKEPASIANNVWQFGRNDRSNEELPPGFRDWTKQDFSVVTPEERPIRTANRPTQMVKTTIPVPSGFHANGFHANGFYANSINAPTQPNLPAVNPLEAIATQNRNGVNPQWNPSQPPPGMLQYIPEPNPIMAASYNVHAQPNPGQIPMPPQNFVPPYLSPGTPYPEPSYNQTPPPVQPAQSAPQPATRVEQQGNTTVTYSNAGYGSNPLSRMRM